MNDKFIRLIAGKRFLVDAMWGFHKLQEIELINELNANSNINQAYFENMKAQSFDIGFYNDNQFVGKSMTDIKKGSIAKISMSGMMTVEDGWCNYGMNSLERELRSLYNSSAVSGIILSVNSGGGYADAGDVLMNAIADRNKPVISHVLFSASAAVKGTLFSDEIIAQAESTEIGSIGVMLVLPKWYVEDAKDNTIEMYSEKSPEKNAAWRAIKEGNLEPYIKQLTELDEVFMSQVRTARPLKGSEKYIAETLSGATFLAKEAKKRGLIDGIGSFNYALKRMNSYIN